MPQRHEWIHSRRTSCRPCVRGMRIRVIDVLELLAAAQPSSQVVEELPDLELEDVRACLRFASWRLDHPVLAA